MLSQRAITTGSYALGWENGELDLLLLTSSSWNIKTLKPTVTKNILKSLHSGQSLQVQNKYNAYKWLYTVHVIFFIITMITFLQIWVVYQHCWREEIKGSLRYRKRKQTDLGLIYVAFGWVSPVINASLALLKFKYKEGASLPLPWSREAGSRWPPLDPPHSHSFPTRRENRRVWLKQRPIGCSSKALHFQSVSPASQYLVMLTRHSLRNRSFHWFHAFSKQCRSIVRLLRQIWKPHYTVNIWVH